MAMREEQKQIQQLARDIAVTDLAPQATALDRECGFPTAGLRRLADAGLMGMVVPLPLGGSGGDTVSFVAAVEEIAKACANTDLVLVTHLAVCMGILASGSDQIKSRLLSPLAKGEKLGAFAATEAGSGANVFAAETSARRDDGTYVINGSKIFVTSGAEADVYIVAARTSPAPGPAGLSLILVERDTPGLTIGRVEQRLGMNGTSSSELFFDECTVPEENLLGQEGGYMQAAMPVLGVALLGAGSISVGLARAALEASINHAKSRTVGGQPIGAHQGVQFLMSEMSCQVEAAQALLFEAAHSRDEGQAGPPILPLETKLFATEMAVDVTNKALQVHGGHGYTRELPLERYLRDARGLTLHFLPSEMLKETLGMMLLGMSP